MSPLLNKENFITYLPVLIPDMFQTELNSSFIEQTLVLWPICMYV